MAVSIDIQPSGVALSRNPIFYRLRATGFASQENYRVAIVVRVNFQESAELIHYPRQNGDIDIDVSDVVAAMIEAATTARVPTLGASNPYVVATGAFVKIKWSERYGEPPVEESEGQTSSIHVVHGGVDALDFAGGQWWANTPSSRSFMSWWPTNRRVARDMPNWLAWTRREANYSGLATIQVEASDSAGQAVPFVAAFTSVNVGTGNIGVFPVGARQLNLPSNVAYYRVRIQYDNDTEGSSQGASTTDWVRYTIDHLPHRTNRYLIALNVWGAPEVIRCTGARVKSFSFDPTVVTRPINFGYARSGGHSFQTAHGQTADYTFRTGYLHEKEIDVIGGLMGIGQMWEVERGELRQVLPKDLKTLAGQADDDETHTLEIKVTRSLQMRNYTPDPDDVPGDPSPDWQRPDGSSWQTPDETWELP